MGISFFDSKFDRLSLPHAPVTVHGSLFAKSIFQSINCFRECVINLIIKVIQVKNNLLKISKEVVKGQNTILTTSV